LFMSDGARVGLSALKEIFSRALVGMLGSNRMS